MLLILLTTLSAVALVIAQEAITNAHKHSSGTRLRIAAECCRGAVRLQVQDSGRGFAPGEATLVEGPGQRIGIAGMQERAALLDGRLTLESSPGAGACVTVTVPILPAGSGEAAPGAVEAGGPWRTR